MIIWNTTLTTCCIPLKIWYNLSWSEWSYSLIPKLRRNVWSLTVIIMITSEHQWFDKLVHSYIFLFFCPWLSYSLSTFIWWWIRSICPRCSCLQASLSSLWMWILASLFNTFKQRQQNMWVSFCTSQITHALWWLISWMRNSGLFLIKKKVTLL